MGKKIGLYLKYSIFLLVVLILILKVITDEKIIHFIFLGLFLYIFTLKLDSRISIGSALLLLVYCPFLLIFKKEVFANHIVTYAYYFLVIGVIKQFIDYIVELKKEKIKDDEYQQYLDLISEL